VRRLSVLNPHFGSRRFWEQPGPFSQFCKTGFTDLCYSVLSARDGRILAIPHLNLFAPKYSSNDLSASEHRLSALETVKKAALVLEANKFKDSQRELIG
jgi:hypothetical protein